MHSLDYFLFFTSCLELNFCFLRFSPYLLFCFLHIWFLQFPIWLAPPISSIWRESGNIPTSTYVTHVHYSVEKVKFENTITRLRRKFESEFGFKFDVELKTNKWKKRIFWVRISIISYLIYFLYSFFFSSLFSSLQFFLFFYFLLFPFKLGIYISILLPYHSHNCIHYLFFLATSGLLASQRNCSSWRLSMVRVKNESNIYIWINIGCNKW